MRGTRIMYSYKAKKIATVVAAIGAVLMLIQKFTQFTVTDKLTSMQHFNLLLWVTLSGLYCMMFSYEKIEDERVKAIRAKSFQILVMMLLGSLMAFAFTMSIAPALNPKEFKDMVVTGDDVVEMAGLLMFFPAVALVLYHVIFQIGMRFEQTWEYEDKGWSLGAIWHDKRYRLLFVVIGFVIIELVHRLMSGN